MSLDSLIFSIVGVDIILVEGYKNANLPALELARELKNREPVGDPVNRIAVATDFPINVDGLFFEL